MSGNKTSAALELLDQVFADDPETERLIDEEALHARIARQIHELRISRNLTQRQLAERVGTSQSAIARLEDADYEGRSLRVLEKVAEALGARLEVRFVAGEAA